MGASRGRSASRSRFSHGRVLFSHAGVLNLHGRFFYSHASALYSHVDVLYSHAGALISHARVYSSQRQRPLLARARRLIARANILLARGCWSVRAISGDSSRDRGTIGGARRPAPSTPTCLASWVFLRLYRGYSIQTRSAAWVQTMGYCLMYLLV
jgi:hypothetical protein